MEGVAEISGSLSGAGLILILTVCLTIYGSATFQSPKSQVGVKTLSGGQTTRSHQPSSLYSTSLFVNQWDFPGKLFTILLSNQYMASSDSELDIICRP